MIRRLFSYLKPHLLPYGLMLLFIVVLLWPLVIGRRLYWGDILLYFSPMLRFGQASLLQGQLPLWNPSIACGQPYLGNPQMSVFYPSSLLLRFLSVEQFLSWNTLLHLWGCGGCMYHFLRAKKSEDRRIHELHEFSRMEKTEDRSQKRHPTPVEEASIWAALGGALVYMGSSCLVARLQFPPMIQTAPYLPLLLFWIERYWRQPLKRGQTLLGLAVTVALMALAGHPQLAYLILGCGLLYAFHLGRESREGGKREGRLWHIGRMAGASCLGLLVSAIQIVPTLQLFVASPREEMTAGQANRFVLEPLHLLTLVFPRFLGHPGSADYWGGGNAWEPSLFMGWLPLFLIGYAVFRRYREREVRFWLVLSLVTVWLAFGNSGGLFWVAFKVIPGISMFHDPARFLYISMFAWAVLASIGIAGVGCRVSGVGKAPQEGQIALSETGQTRRSAPTSLWSLILLLIAAPLWWYGWDWNPTRKVASVSDTRHPTPDTRTYFPKPELHWKRFITDGYSDYGVGEPRYGGYFRDTVMPNLEMESGAETASYYEPVPVYAATLLDGMARVAFRRGEPNFLRLLTVMNVGTVVLPESIGSGVPQTRLVSKEHRAVSVWENPTVLPRAWVVRHIRQVEGRTRVISALGDPEFDPSQVAIVSGGVEGWEADLEGRGAEPAFEKATVRIVNRSAERMECEVEMFSNPGFLVVSSTAYPGWKGKVDGKARTIHCVNGAFLGVGVPPSRHRVSFTYVPDMVRIGSFLSLLGVGICTFWRMYLWRGRA